MTKSKSMSFLSPILTYYNDNIIWKYVESVYVGDVEYSGDTWGENIFLLLDTTDEMEISKYRKSEYYIYELDKEDNKVMLVFSIPEDLGNKVVQPLLDGKYSQIDRKYVNKHFSKYTEQGLPSSNWMILHKSDVLRKYWEDRIGVSLPEDAEVWDAPTKKTEIYGYSKG